MWNFGNGRREVGGKPLQNICAYTNLGRPFFSEGELRNDGEVHLQPSFLHHHLSIRVCENVFVDIGVRWATLPVKEFDIILQQQLTYHHLQLTPGQPATRTGIETSSKVEMALVWGGILVPLALTGLLTYFVVAEAVKFLLRNNVRIP